MLHPRGKVRGPVLMRLPLRLPAFIPLVFWVGFQAVMFFAADGEAVSWLAHVGGIIAEAVLVIFIRRRAVPLFDRQIMTPEAVETADSRQRDQTDMRWGRQ